VPAGAIRRRDRCGHRVRHRRASLERGVLLALDGLARRRRIRRPLDIAPAAASAIAAQSGCGRRVLGSDVDGAAAGSPPITSGGNGGRAGARDLRAGAIAAAPCAAEYDLILANILARRWR